MRPYIRPSLTPLGTVQQLTKSKKLPGVPAAIPGAGVLPLAIDYFPPS